MYKKFPMNSINIAIKNDKRIYTIKFVIIVEPGGNTHNDNFPHYRHVFLDRMQ